MDLNSTPPLILAVDDNDQNLSFLRICLRNAGYRVNTASDGLAAMEQVHTNRPDLVLLDVMMPGISGFEVCKNLKENEETWFIPVVIITALADPESRLTGIESGADDFITKPFNKPELLTRVKSLLRVKSLHDELDTAQNVVFTLVLALEAKDPYLQGHAERVGRFSEYTAREMGFPELDQRTIRFAGILHDIGKIGIKDEVLKKTGALSPEDWAEMKKHPEIGEKICLPLRATKQLLPIIRNHQEKYDGTGYPDGLKGEAIPIGARIMAVADAFDAMTSDRPYRKGLPAEEALKRLEEGRGGHFDPAIVDAFVRVYQDGEIAKIMKEISEKGSFMKETLGIYNS